MAVFKIKDVIHPEKTDKENLKLLQKAVRKNEEEIFNLQVKTKQRNILMTTEQGTDMEIKPIPLKKETVKINQVDVSIQLELLSCCNTLEDLFVFLPSKEDKDYYPVLHTMLLELQKQLVSCELVIRKNKISNKDNQAFSTLNKINQMQILLSDYMEEQEEDTLINNTITHPTLLYTTTKAGKVCLLNDLKGISDESYPEFLILFESIVSGNLKSPKMINTSAGKYRNSFYQIKLNQSRMTFHVLTKDCVVISSAFTKKVQKNRVLGDKFKRIDKNFSDNKDFFLKNYTNPEFQRVQEQITETIYKTLRKER